MLDFSDLGTSQPYYFAPESIPMLPSLNLSEDERLLISQLQARGELYRSQMLRTDAYYRGMQVIKNLGIAIPPELQGLRTLVGWARVAVDPIVERLCIDGFRLPGQTDTDSDLLDVWRLNGMDAEQILGFTDALVMGQAYLVVGSPMEAGDVPVMNMESPLNLSALWDVRTGKAKAALQSYWEGQTRHAAVHLPNQTIHIAQNNDYEWVVTDRDAHNFGRVPIVRIANQPRSNMRDGASEITPELMSLIDAACRTLLSMQVAGEFYSVPQKVILGAAESDFQSPDGSMKKAWDTYVSHIIALERDEDGNLPTIQQMVPYDPSVFTKVVEMFAAQAASIVRAPAQDFGLYTQGNPVSAEAAQVSEGGRDRKARMKQNLFGVPMREGMQLVTMFMNGGTLPADARRMEVDWADPAMFNLAGASDAITKQIASGAIPAVSDVTQKRLGYNAIERERLEIDRKVDQGQSMLQEIAHSLDAKAFRADKALTADAAHGAGQPDPNAPTPAVMPKKMPVSAPANK